jgi:hypothetical protein
MNVLRCGERGKLTMQHLIYIGFRFVKQSSHQSLLPARLVCTSVGGEEGGKATERISNCHGNTESFSFCCYLGLLVVKFYVILMSEDIFPFFSSDMMEFPKR